METLSRRARKGIAFWGTATAVLSFVLFALASRGTFGNLHRGLSNALAWRGEGQASDQIVIVEIDEDTLARRRESELGTLRLSKSDYAKVVDRLADAGAAAIGIDVILSESSPASEVKALADAIASHPQVVLALRPSSQGVPELLPLPEIADVGNGRMGSVLFVPDRDNVVRRQSAGADHPETPAFAIQILNAALQQGTGSNRKEPGAYVVSDEAYRVGNARVAPIRVPLDAHGDFRLNFFAPPGSYRRLSFADVLDGNLAGADGKPVDLQGKIVLIGEVGTALHDEQAVPISYGAPMSGVEIHANAVQTLVSGRYLREQSARQSFLVAAILGTAALAAFLILSIPLSFALFVLCVIGYTLATWVAYEEGMVLDTVLPYLALFAAFAAAYAFRYFTEARIAAQTKQAFGLYVSPYVVHEIVEHPELVTRGGRKETLTVFFSDIAGFTTIAEQTDPTTLVADLNEYLDEMSKVVFSTDGTIDKFIGDAIMAFWNAPLPQSDHAARACLTALDYLAKLEELNGRRAAKGKPPFHARIGINTGEMVVGNVGSSNRFDYTVIGDAVNLAARLEGANKSYGTRVLVAEATLAGAKDSVEAREIDLVAVKGKKQPVRIFELLGRKGAVPPEKLRVKVLFEEGLAAYRAQRWDEAEGLFRQILKAGSDAVSEAYLERVKALKTAVLPDDWDGVFEMKTK